MTQQTPMGVSQWRNYGAEMGYYAYFKEEIKKEIREEVEKMAEDPPLESNERRRGFHKAIDDILELLK